jgi:RNA polymerase sigma-70 factor (ECF subfamily)
VDADPSPGSLHEFERVALPLFDALFNVALHLTRSRPEAEDLVQETYLKAFRHFASYQPGTHVKAWLIRILRNTFINRYRASKARPQQVEQRLVELAYDRWIDESFLHDRGPDTPEELLLHDALDAEVEQALHDLPEEYRSVVVLALIEDMPYKEIAFALSIPVGTVMSRLHRGRRLLQASLLDYARRKGIIRRAPDVSSREELS